MYQPPYMPLYVDDFEASTAHLTIEEDGIYNRLLRLCWRSSGCSIPDDPKWVSRRMRCHIEYYHEAIEPVVREFFHRENGRIFNPRQRREFAAVVETYKKRAAAGAKGGRPRKLLESNETDQRQAKGRRKAGLSNQNQNQNHNYPSQISENLGEDFTNDECPFWED